MTALVGKFGDRVKGPKKPQTPLKKSKTVHFPLISIRFPLGSRSGASQLRDAAQERASTRPHTNGCSQPAAKSRPAAQRHQPKGTSPKAAATNLSLSRPGTVEYQSWSNSAPASAAQLCLKELITKSWFTLTIDKFTSDAAFTSNPNAVKFGIS